MKKKLKKFDIKKIYVKILSKIPSSDYFKTQFIFRLKYNCFLNSRKK